MSCGTSPDPRLELRKLRTSSPVQCHAENLGVVTLRSEIETSIVRAFDPVPLRSKAGLPRRAAELKKAETIHGELHKEREDVFRALARAVAPGLNARDLAAVTVHHAEEQA